MAIELPPTAQAEIADTAPELPTLDEIQEAVREAERAAADAAHDVLDAAAARVFQAAENAKRHRASALARADSAWETPLLFDVQGDRDASMAQCYATWAAVAARRASRWARRYAKLLAAQQGQPE